MNPIYVARIKSLAWRTGWMLLAGGSASVLANINLLQLTPNEVILAGLILGELSKLANDAISAQA